MKRDIVRTVLYTPYLRMVIQWCCLLEVGTLGGLL